MLKIKEYEIVHTGGGIYVAFGVFTNGQGFMLGSAGIGIYNTDSRKEWEVDDQCKWEEEHIVEEKCDYDALFIDALQFIFKDLKLYYSASEILEKYDLFWDNADLLTI